MVASGVEDRAGVAPPVTHRQGTAINRIRSILIVIYYTSPVLVFNMQVVSRVEAQLGEAIFECP